MLSEETKQRNRVLRHATKDLASITKMVSILNTLVPDKIYRITYLKYRLISQRSFEYADSIIIGTPTKYTNQGITFRILAAEHYDKREWEVTVEYDRVVGWEEWANRDSPQLEAPLLVNFEYVSPEMKDNCFNLK